MGRKAKTLYTVYKVSIHAHDIGTLLEMLRYEFATVENWTIKAGDRPGMGTYIVTLRSERFTPGRWESFAIRPEVLNTFAV